MSFILDALLGLVIVTVCVIVGGGLIIHILAKRMEREAEERQRDPMEHKGEYMGDE
jgi:hypothetical protein